MYTPCIWLVNFSKFSFALNVSYSFIFSLESFFFLKDLCSFLWLFSLVVHVFFYAPYMRLNQSQISYFVVLWWDCFISQAYSVLLSERHKMPAYLCFYDVNELWYADLGNDNLQYSLSNFYLFYITAFVC